LKKSKKLAKFRHSQTRLKKKGTEAMEKLFTIASQLMFEITLPLVGTFTAPLMSVVIFWTVLACGSLFIAITLDNKKEDKAAN
jgi:hypothetical protein